jgi:hypothetical protein
MANDFIAFTSLNDNISFFSDPWCRVPGAVMHEVGKSKGEILVNDD